MAFNTAKLDNLKQIRSAWVEIDHSQLRENFSIIQKYAPPHCQRLCVVKDNAYGHGSVLMAKEAIRAGYSYLSVETIGEAVTLRENGIEAPILLFGEPSIEEMRAALVLEMTVCINSIEQANTYLSCIREYQAQHPDVPFSPKPVHIEVDSGMSRWGVRWTEAMSVVDYLHAHAEHIALEGIMSHFAMSDEADKSYALLQLNRFTSVLDQVQASGITIPLIHMSNTGGVLDLPSAHFTMVRTGILPTGVYPSLVCNQYPGLRPVLSVKCKITTLRQLEVGDKVGYGMHFTAEKPMQIAVLPIGYGDGYPRVRNNGYVLIRGTKCPTVGGNAMDAMMVDVSHLPAVALNDEVVLMGGQGKEWIDPRDLVPWKKTVCYEILTGWRARLPRKLVNIPD
ncbi:alanine racemase [Opacimonas viscosa]|uniref:Alanine racemase n=1 Tax=Opacimonas viscosa TaxID=2961944 RepID=A0AA42BPN8_9ALTE|nr:alanine racemase [Opacimonas viscosa]MCP3428621.1 alanine racemase [Opacimonas viscosa]